ncbi:MAG: bifunctional 5,10-methylenetetrahydrofolate dehydrogenase/5,10-methenyltetrahydrofolate cyclohydrolase [Candidatus Moranbacteria bacterium]|nr:bifunctional 5,10-methylenetetrahydrofolate dehydrogenase/5,10-methenyltetrahydrofolate cyclohydrolase [Candidatus Moranbacteria bacterium]MBP6034129.1 bifunctional 5,10-methylenetetrahydrofolate dehydrogenase/5,10-methenyltetrahydrofolate cyclohydrolase [Candidatus Moranbacteria bacterium]MBP7695881.1 bifunctional 5,10-methylenetetrahydrofolate dehydrogenase/5,10-methenyltetrahydrofolate cyclohydrolase [Candidatus Moranbacteria bacterium]
MQLLYGKPVAERIQEEIRGRVAGLPMRPGLGVVLVGDDPASHLYVDLKAKAAAALGIRLEQHVFKVTDTEAAVLECIDALNHDDTIHGIIVQLPLPSGFDTDRVIAAIDPEKDADGFHQSNIEAFLTGESSSAPVFPEALIEMLRSSGEVLEGKQALVIAHSEYFGGVLQKACENIGLRADVLLSSMLDSQREKISVADIILTASGMPGSIDGSVIASGTIIVDGGIAKWDGRVVGDVDAESVADKAGFLSPVPGGVGPVTIACLLRRVVALAEAKKKSA